MAYLLGLLPHPLFHDLDRPIQKAVCFRSGTTGNAFQIWELGDPFSKSTR